MNGLTKGKALAYLASVFVAGLVTGGIGGYTVARQREFRPPPPPGSMAAGITERLRAELGLDAGQVDKVRPLVERLSEELRALQKDGKDRFLATIKETNRRIAEFLTPAQKIKLEEMERKHEQLMREGHRHGPKPPPGPGGPPPRPAAPAPGPGPR